MVQCTATVAVVVKRINPIWTMKTGIATRLRGCIESIIDWATKNKFRRDEIQCASTSTWRTYSPNPNQIARAYDLPYTVEAAYRRSDLVNKRVRLMQAHAKYYGGTQISS